MRIFTPPEFRTLQKVLKCFKSLTNIIGAIPSWRLFEIFADAWRSDPPKISKNAEKGPKRAKKRCFSAFSQLSGGTVN